MKWVAYLAAALLMTGAVVGSVATRRADGAGRREKTRAPVRVIKLRLTAEKDLATISTPSGVTATMSREGGEQIALTPSLRTDGIDLTVAVKDVATAEFKVVGRYSLVRNVPTDISTARTWLSVDWLGTATVTTAPLAVGMAPCTTCCVICDGTTFCACEVTTSCGHCCCKEACGCNDGAP